MDRINAPTKARGDETSNKAVDTRANTTESNERTVIRSSEPSSIAVGGVPPAVVSDTEAAEGTGLRQALMERCVQSRWSPDPRSMIRFDGQPSGPGREEFRALRARLNLVRERQRLQKLLITSALPEEGKTFVAANLAQAVFWQQERQILLVDGDLRASHLHLALGAPLAPGLSDYLSGNADEFAIIKRGSQPNFFFIPSGRTVSNPTELLENGKLRVLLQRVASAFDWIIIDAPPVVLVPDAKVIAELCDGVLVVIRAGETPFDLAQKAYSEFRGKSFLGVVLNRVDARLTYGYHYYYERKARTAGSNGKKR
ncbi:MAG: CpsD/CapB family tyrosine-protein kinase [Terriglobia bacterium]|jgi:capsular exopolysaccharide synthesis family protein